VGKYGSILQKLRDKNLERARIWVAENDKEEPPADWLEPKVYRPIKDKKG
jgi:hypothetical protein